VPTYAYACKDCDHAFDIQQTFAEDSLTVCPQCEGALRKKFNSVGVVFKGSGFYRTDSREAKGTTTAVKDAGSKPTSDTAGSSSASSTTSSSSGAANSGGAASTSTAAGASKAAAN
jgi:putative FmdB family regulatory protein